MSLKYALFYTSCLWILVLPKPLTRNHQRDATILTASVTSFNVTGDEDIHIHCDGSSYGFDLDITDCEEAEAYVPFSPDPVWWAERHTGWQKKIFPLPYRAMGDKGMCYVQPVLINDASSAQATPNQVRNAAAAIRHKCASGGKLQGGIATSIGGDNNLAVIMGAYKPLTIQCNSSFPVTTSCLDLLEDMPATTDNKTFNPPADPTAKVLFAQAVESGDTRCQLNIISTSPINPSESASWYEIWEATTAIWSVCGRHQQGGTLGGIGDHGKLLLTLNSQPSRYPVKGPMALHSTKFYGSGPGKVLAGTERAG